MNIAKGDNMIFEASRYIVTDVDGDNIEFAPISADGTSHGTHAKHIVSLGDGLFAVAGRMERSTAAAIGVLIHNNAAED